MRQRPIYWLDAAPLGHVLDRHRSIAETEGQTRQDFASCAGVDAGWIQEVITGKRTRVRLARADEILTRLDESLASTYPGLYS